MKESLVSFVGLSDVDLAARRTKREKRIRNCWMVGWRQVCLRARRYYQGSVSS